MKFERLGWIVAAALAGGMVGMGFQGAAEKTGTVDVGKVVNDSDFIKKQIDTLKAMHAARLGVVDFVKANPHMKADAITKFKDLSLKDNPTAADKADLERLKQDAQAGESSYRALAQKDKPTPDDLKQMEALNRQKDENSAALDKLSNDFNTEMQAKQEALRSDVSNRAKDAIQTAGKQQGYTIIFTNELAPYSANDITADALKAMNSKK